MRNSYQESVRDDPATFAFAKWMASLGGRISFLYGRPDGRQHARGLRSAYCFTNVQLSELSGSPMVWSSTTLPSSR